MALFWKCDNLHILLPIFYTFRCSAFVLHIHEGTNVKWIVPAMMLILQTIFFEPCWYEVFIHANLLKIQPSFYFSEYYFKNYYTIF